MAARIIRNSIKIGYVDIYCVKHRASVGVSSNDILFSKKQIAYYEDIAKYVEYELLPYPKYYGRIMTYQKLRVARFRCDICYAHTKTARLLLVIRNIDTIFLYAIYQPRNAINMLNKLIQVSKK